MGYCIYVLVVAQILSVVTGPRIVVKIRHEERRNCHNDHNYARGMDLSPAKQQRMEGTNSGSGDDGAGTGILAAPDMDDEESTQPVEHACPKISYHATHQGALLSAEARQFIRDVNSYMRLICSNPDYATTAATKVSYRTLRTTLEESTDDALTESTSSVSTKKRKQSGGRPRADIDDFDASVIRMVIHRDYYKKKRSPTIDKILESVLEELRNDDGTTRFPYGRSVLYKVMQDLGFKYKKQAGPDPYMLFARADIIEGRAVYLRWIRQYRQEGRVIVYLDETWYNCNEAPGKSWHDTRALADPYISTKAGSGLTMGKLPTGSGRGQRLIVINAITKNGPVPNALLVMRTKGGPRPEDYHDDMNAHNFEKWLVDQLLPNIPDDAIIVMDNAPYHSRRSQKLPSSGRRADVILQLETLGFFQFLADRGYPNNPNEMTMKQIFDLCRLFRSQFDKMAVEKIVKEHGHGQIVLRLPPYHCILNPIEMLWSYQKGKLRSASTQRTIAQALDDCNVAFTQIPNEDLSRYFSHVEKEEEKFWKLDSLIASPTFHPPVVIDADDSEDSDSDESLDDAPVTMALYGLEDSDDES